MPQEMIRDIMIMAILVVAVVVTITLPLLFLMDSRRGKR